MIHPLQFNLTKRSVYIYYTTHNLIASRANDVNYEFKGNHCVQISLGYLVGDDDAVTGEGKAHDDKIESAEILK